MDLESGTDPPVCRVMLAQSTPYMPFKDMRRIVVYIFMVVLVLVQFLRPFV